MKYDNFETKLLEIPNFLLDLQVQSKLDKGVHNYFVPFVRTHYTNIA